MKKNQITKKIIVALLLVIGLVLMVAEGADIISTLVIKFAAVVSMVSCAALFRHWRLSDDPTIQKLVND